VRIARIALAAAGFALGACGPLRVPANPPLTAPSTCVPAGRWIDPANGFGVALPDVVRRAVGARIVLLGEDHTNADHHRWQLHVAAAVAGASEEIVLGFEMLPRGAAAALDRWIAGTITRDAFLRETDWKRVWGFSPDLYWPLFDFVRLQRIPARGLNVSHGLVARVGKVGWSGVPVADREGVSTPAPATPAYRDRLREAFAAHGTPATDAGAFDHFVEAQLTWDRAMAEALAEALAAHPRATVVGVMGRGHLEHGDGIPAQLVALGAPRPLVLLPWDAERDCSDLAPGLADVVFGMGLPTGTPAGDTGS